MIDVNTIQELLIAAAWLVPVITGIVQVIKTTFPSLDQRFIPILSLLTGILAGTVVLGFSLTGGFAGLIFGLTASGFYDLGKKTVAGK
jgi:hypothetical protein